MVLYIVGLIPLSSPISDSILTRSQVSSQIKTQTVSSLWRKKGIRCFHMLVIFPTILQVLPVFRMGEYKAQKGWVSSPRSCNVSCPKSVLQHSLSYPILLSSAQLYCVHTSPVRENCEGEGCAGENGSHNGSWVYLNRKVPSKMLRWPRLKLTWFLKNTRYPSFIASFLTSLLKEKKKYHTTDRNVLFTT